MQSRLTEKFLQNLRRHENIFDIVTHSFSCSNEIDIAPLPQPISKTRPCFFTLCLTMSTKYSVSGRGMKTGGINCSFANLKSQSRIMYWTGTLEKKKIWNATNKFQFYIVSINDSFRTDLKAEIKKLKTSRYRISRLKSADVSKIAIIIWLNACKCKKVAAYFDWM